MARPYDDVVRVSATSKVQNVGNFYKLRFKKSQTNKESNSEAAGLRDLAARTDTVDVSTRKSYISLRSSSVDQHQRAPKARVVQMGVRVTEMKSYL